MKRIDLSSEKLRNAIIYFVNNTRYLGVTKLMKLLYFLDFCHYKSTGRSVTGLSYSAWERGPVPVQVWNELNAGSGELHLDSVVQMQKVPGRNFYPITPVGMSPGFDDEVFTEREFSLLSLISSKFERFTSEQMVEATHLPNRPWDITLQTKGQNAIIDYEIVLQGREDSEEVGCIRDWQNNRKEVESILSQL